jgi:Lrp/AsnC family transcriptional regulator, regulator for asnA, asnC and gidA
MQKPELDPLDRSIIALLTEDGRLSATEIAQRLGTASERTIRNRIAALLQSRRIAIAAIPDPTAMGDGVKADLMIDVEPGRIDAIAAALGEHDEVGYLASTTGPWNLIASVMVADHAALFGFCETVVAALPGVRKVEPRITLKMYKVYGTRTTALNKVAP